MGECENSSCTLWLGTGGNRECPLFKDPEQLRRKFRAWMWPHDFEVSMTQLDPGGADCLLNGLIEKIPKIPPQPTYV